MMNSFMPGPYCPVSNAFNILKTSHSESFEIEKIDKAQQPKQSEKGTYTICLLPGLFYLLWPQILETLNSLITIFHSIF